MSWAGVGGHASAAEHLRKLGGTASRVLKIGSKMGVKFEVKFQHENNTEQCIEAPGNGSSLIRFHPPKQQPPLSHFFLFLVRAVGPNAIPGVGTPAGEEAMGL